MDNHVFARSGLASLDDLQDPGARELFGLLELEQEAFLGHDAAFRSPGYKWPRAPLHNWSRCWEYPYVYRAIRDELRLPGQAVLPVVADVSSGVTFFPFAVAKLGWRVICTDVDPVCGPDFEKVGRVVSGAPGQVSFRPCTPERLPLANEECAAVYCISVIEHVKNPEHTVAEMHRILKPGGLLCLTIDLDLRGAEIGPEGYVNLHRLLRRHFELAVPERGIHPTRMLTSNRGPFPVPDPPGPTGLRLLARNVLADYLGTDLQPVVPCLLAVEGTLWRKPAGAAAVKP